MQQEHTQQLALIPAQPVWMGVIAPLEQLLAVLAAQAISLILLIRVVISAFLELLTEYLEACVRNALMDMQSAIVARLLALSVLQEHI